MGDFSPATFRNDCTNLSADEDFGIQGFSRLGYDNCAMVSDTKQSRGPGHYQLDNFKDCNCEAPVTEKLAHKYPDVHYRDGYGWTSHNGCNVDNDSNLRNSRNLTQLRCRRNLNTRPYLTVPYMGRGPGDTGTESFLRPGTATNYGRPCNTLGGVHTEQQFIPLVSCLQETIQNPIHIIPEDSDRAWRRGGLPSRQMVRNLELMDRCGYKTDGKYWSRD